MDFDQAWELLKDAVVISDHIEKEEVENGLKAGSFKLFFHQNSVALIVHQNGFLRVGLAGGVMEDLLVIEKDVCEYAKCRGDKFIEIISRPGWERALENYQRVAVVLRKEL